jgi:hypothetical protein
MAEELQIEKDLVEDLLSRLSGKGKKGREAAIEALAVSTEDGDWRPDELIKQGGIEIIRDLLGEKNTHIVLFCPGDHHCHCRIRACQRPCE